MYVFIFSNQTLLGRMQVATSDDLYSLLAQDALSVDLYASALAEPERVHLFIDETTARAWSVALADFQSLVAAGKLTGLTEPPDRGSDRRWQDDAAATPGQTVHRGCRP